LIISDKLKIYLLNKIKSKILFDEPMRNHTTIRVGGSCAMFFEPNIIIELLEIIKFLNEKKIKFYVIGNGSNLLVDDLGFDGAIIKINKNFEKNNIEIKNETIICSAGILLPKISKIAYENNLSGFEFACGIPGTVGGSVCMNAGAYDSEMKNVVFSCDIFDTNDNEIKIFNNKELNFDYRSSIISEKYIILCAKFKLFFKNNKEEIKKTMTDFNNKRKNKQPIEFPSAGSIFKRPKGFYVGKLIQDAGLAGFTIGGAQISKKHCGFMINIGNATAQNFLDLIELTKKIISNRFGVKLQTEIKYLKK
jgi:UDP-N-acetylmuramate dehydrogenase